MRVVLDDDDLRAARRRLRRDGGERDREVVAPLARGEEDAWPWGRESVGVALQPVILLLHHRYRHAGGEERAVEDLAWLIREHLGEDVEVLRARLGARSAAARRRSGLLRGRAAARSRSADAVRRTGARVVHAHNIGADVRLARAGRGARGGRAGRAAPAQLPARVRGRHVLHAAARTARAATAATRCPGVRLNCRGGSRAESAAYAAGLALWQRRLAGAADAIVVPSAFALGRLRELGAPLGDKARVLGSVQREFAERSTRGATASSCSPPAA